MSDLDKMKHEPPRTTEQAAAGTPPPPPPAHPNPAVVEEAGSRALAEALRSSFVIVKVLMVLLVIAFFASGIFTVPSQEQAIVLRFGRPVGVGKDQLLGPGLHFSLPYPIDEVVRIPIGTILSANSTAGWYQTTPEAEAANQEAPPNMTLNPAADSYTLTADGNIIHARATVQYHIVEPLRFVLDFVNARTVVTNALDSALFYASTQFTANQAVREDQQGFQDVLLKRVRDLVDRQNLGIQVDAIIGLRIIPPRQVKQAFEAVTTAEIERRQARDQAHAYAATNMSTAYGAASSLVNEGRSDATQLLQDVSSEARYFTNQLASYESNPSLFEDRLQAEALGRILSKSGGKIFSLPPERKGEKPDLWLQLNQLPKNRRSPIEVISR
jgi:membrane protease subunit HflK